MPAVTDSASVAILDRVFVPYIGEAEIRERVAALAAQISADYKDLRPLFVAILNGSFIFASDLFRGLSIEAEISFVKPVSYQGTSSTGDVATAIGLDEELSGRHVIVLEDIVDTGKTLCAFLPVLHSRGPASIKIAAFLDKKEARTEAISPDYTAFGIPDRFVVGYGMDYDGFGRQLPALYQLDG